MFEHFVLDNKKVPGNKANDPDYNQEEKEIEHYEDPDFDRLWDMEDPSDADIQGDVFPKTDIDDTEEWEEV